MASDKELDDFIKDIPPSSNYLDLGFNTSLSKAPYLEEGQSTADFGALLEGMDFDKLIGSGIASNAGGRLKIDFNKGQIVINDGQHDRVLIGDLEDG